MKASITPYLRLARLDKPIGIWLLLLPAWWSILLAAGGVTRMNGGDWGVFILFGFGAVAMRAAGCIINDLWDRDLDRQVARTKDRPLASGQISAASAFAFLLMLLFLSFVILLQMNLVTILLGVLSLPFIIVYPLMKRFTWWPQAFLGLTFNFGAPMGWAAVTGVVGLPALLLYAGGFFWTLGYDTIYAHQDIEDDALAGVKSTARKFGARSLCYVRCFHALALLLIAAACLCQGAGLAVLFLLPGAGHMVWQMKAWRQNDTESALRVFKSNRDFGLIILAGISCTMFYMP